MSALNLINKYKNLSIYKKAAVWFVISSFFQKGISLLTTPIFTRLLSTTEYGQYTLYASWLNILSIFVTFKLAEAVFNKSMIAVEDEDRKHVLASFQLLVLIVWCVFFCTFLVFQNHFSVLVKLPKTFIMLMFAEILFEANTALWIAYQRFQYKYVLLIILTLSFSLLNPIIGLYAVTHMVDKALGRIIGIVLAQSIIGLFTLSNNIRGISLVNFRGIWKDALLFNIPLIPHYLSQVLLNQADRIMISRIISDSAAGLYGVAYTIGMLATMITSSINNAYVPWMYRKLKEKEYTEINKNNVMLLLIVGCIVSLIYLTAPEIIILLGGHKYVEAIKVIYPVAASVFMMFLYTIFANVELFYGERKFVTIGTCLAALLNLVLNWKFIPKYGYIAASYTTLFCYICYSAFHIIVVTRLLKNKENRIVDVNIIPISVIVIVVVVLAFVLQSLIELRLCRYALLAILILLLVIKRKSVISYFVMYR